jgi:hypothetical protein
MPDEFQHLIDDFLDDQLSSEKQRRLNELLQGNASRAQRFARAMLLHDRLHAEIQAGALAREEVDALHDQFLKPPRPIDRRWTVTAAASIAALVMLTFFLWHGGTAPSAAVAALDRMIEAASQPIDRVYRIRVTDAGPHAGEPPVFSEANGRKPGIDGAQLYVRGSDQFVLVRRFGNGTKFVTGSDGAIGWAVAPTGQVHLSRDTRRFRRAVPGEHEELPFIDLPAGFKELRRDYHLDLTKADQGDLNNEGQSQLVAERRADKRRGPERVQIWFDAQGVAHRIALSGLPLEEGRALGVELELVEQRDLGLEFFHHEAHHTPDRPIDWE